MKTLVFIFALISITLLGLSSCVSHYYIVRHAEKQPGVTDAPAPNGPALKEPEGTTRAFVLCDSLRNKNVQHIFVSQYLRTQKTAEPTARALGIATTEYDRNAEVAILAAQLRAIDRDDVLVVGHSDTVPILVFTLTGVSLGYMNDTIPDNDYDNFFVVRRYKGLGPVRYTLERRGTYGAVSP